MAKFIKDTKVVQFGVFELRNRVMNRTFKIPLSSSPKRTAFIKQVGKILNRQNQSNLKS